MKAKKRKLSKDEDKRDSLVALGSGTSVGGIIFKKVDNDEIKSERSKTNSRETLSFTSSKNRLNTSIQPAAPLSKTKN